MGHDDPMPSNSCSVLIVEDDEKLQEVLRAILARHATSVDVALDGERAIEMLQGRAYDVVVLDLMLPKRNGFLVAEAIATLEQQPRLIVLSALSRYFHDRFPAGTVVLQKPHGIDQLTEVMRGVRGEAGPAARAVTPSV